MFYNNRFTEKAENALRLAQESAVSLGHNYVGSEHLLLGLLKEGTGVAAKALISQGVTENGIISRIEELTGIGNEPVVQPIGLTPRTKHILEYSVIEANQMGSNYVGTEHILLGLLREGDSVAVRILNDLGVDVARLYNEINQNNDFSHQTPAKNSHGKKVATPTLDQFSRNLNEIAKKGKIDPVIGRDKEIERVIQILCRRTKNNPCLIGEPGVGKTAIAEGLAQRVVSGNLPDILKDKIIYCLDLSAMIAGAKYRGEFEDRLKKAMEEICNDGNIILFIDEIHTLVGAGAAEGAIDAANILKPSLARGDIQVIGATTLDEYRKYIEKDSALERRFQPVLVDEPTPDEALTILKGIRDKYEAHHSVKITDEALEAAVKLSQRYITDRYLPDKAIDLIDEAASRVRLQAYTTPPNVKKIEEKIAKIATNKEEAVRAQDFEKAAKLRDEERLLKQEVKQLREKWTEKNQKSTPNITEEVVAAIVSGWTGIPTEQLTKDESERLMQLEQILHRRVIGQDEAVVSISKAIRRGRVGLKDEKRPIGSFIFLGPTGVGKTELSKALAEAMFGDEEAIIRIDMSEYMEKHSVSKLIGSPPGYVGYEEGGQLTERVRRKPYSVILFDEMEKAHPDVFNILLQILEDGILTDSQGRRVDFRNTVIIMTSNVGARMISERKQLGFGLDQGQQEQDYKKIKSDVMGELKKAFRPEFLNRVDDIIVFHQLNEEHIKKIAQNMLEGLKKKLKDMNFSVEFTDFVIEMVAKEGFDIVYGARPLRRVIQTKIEDLIAEKMLEGKISEGDNILLDVEGDSVKVVKK
jgi:ATP-dependent Clp protease ATP-binding subunit ClpC